MIMSLHQRFRLPKMWSAPYFQHVVDVIYFYFSEFNLLLAPAPEIESCSFAPWADADMQREIRINRFER